MRASGRGRAGRCGARLRVRAAEAFPPDEPRNLYGHLRVADFSDAVAALPPEELQVGTCLHDGARVFIGLGFSEGSGSRVSTHSAAGSGLREPYSLA